MLKDQLFDKDKNQSQQESVIRTKI